MNLYDLPENEIAILRATWTSENVMSLPDIAQAANMTLEEAISPTLLLVKKDILEIVDSHDGAAIGYSSSDYAQGVYAALRPVTA